MVRKIFVYSILLLCPVSEASIDDFDCNQFLRLPIELQRNEFVSARDQLIEHFCRSEQDGFTTAELADLIGSKDFDPEIGNGIYLAHLPELILDTNREISTEFVKSFSSRVNRLEDIGKCFHYQTANTTTEPLMALKLYEQKTRRLSVNTNRIFFGYTTVTLLDNQPVTVIRGTSTDECKGDQCTFKHIPLERGNELITEQTVIRMTHSPKELNTVISAVQALPDEHFLPSKTWLTELTLYKTGEVFTSPEIYTLIFYYSGDRPITKVVRPLPWVNKKGVNKGSSLLLDWPGGSDSAKVVLMESDLDLPYKAIVDIISAIIQHFSAISSVAIAITERMQDEPVLPTGSERWGCDDYIGTVTVNRRDAINEIMTDEGSATFKFKHQ